MHLVCLPFGRHHQQP